LKSKKEPIRGCKQPPYLDISRADIARIANPELADLLSGWRTISALARYLSAEPLVREVGALSKIGSHKS
jgi:hypothetical protein